MRLFIIGLVVLVCAYTITGEWVKEMENSGLYEGDIVLDPDEKEGALKGNAFASIKGGRWPNNKIPYSIDGSIGYAGINAINAAIAQYHKHTCLRFHKRTNERAYIRFYRGGGCSSPVGYRYGRRNDISLAGGCWHTGTVMHEIGHSIGIFHEQSRPDRDTYVTILWNNIQGGMGYNFNKASNIDSLGTPYDFRSMMHYGATAFGGGRRTIQAKDRSKQHLIGNRSGFSTIDIKQINLMYPCVEPTSEGSGGGSTDTTTVTPTTDGSGTRPTNPPTECKDYHRHCNYWARIGECRKNPGYMLKWCKKSCRSCNGCKDNHTSCNYWANRNPSECTKNPRYMLKYCKKACKVC